MRIPRYMLLTANTYGLSAIKLNHASNIWTKDPKLSGQIKRVDNDLRTLRTVLRPQYGGKEAQVDRNYYPNRA